LFTMRSVSSWRGRHRPHDFRGIRRRQSCVPAETDRQEQSHCPVPAAGAAAIGGGVVGAIAEGATAGGPPTDRPVNVSANDINRVERLHFAVHSKRSTACVPPRYFRATRGRLSIPGVRGAMPTKNRARMLRSKTIPFAHCSSTLVEDQASTQFSRVLRAPQGPSHSTALDEGRAGWLRQGIRRLKQENFWHTGQQRNAF